MHAFDTTLGSEGIDPAGVTVDEHGNIFGVTSGDVNSGQFGVAFELTTSGKAYSERVLYSFSCATDGCVPESAPALDAKTGNLYVSNNEGGPGFGTIIELSPAGSSYVRTGLYAFVSGAGDQPLGVPLLLDGRVYVTACCNGGDSGGGTISALVPNGLAGIQLYYFTSGGILFDGLIPDDSGKLYGTTFSDGPSGVGSVFSFAPSKTGGRESVLYDFAGGLDGQYPTAPVVIDAGGNIYGTTEEGGTKSIGTVFKLTPQAHGYTETILHRFAGSPDGSTPIGGLTLVGSSLWGTTLYGGEDKNCNCGTIFSLSTSGTNYSVRHSFRGTDGMNPNSTMARHGRALYGTTYEGGPQATSFGVVFQVVP